MSMAYECWELPFAFGPWSYTDHYIRTISVNSAEWMPRA